MLQYRCTEPFVRRPDLLGRRRRAWANSNPSGELCCFTRILISSSPHRLHPVTGAQRIKVTFNAATSEALPWTFTPQQKHVWVLPGETSLAFYTAKNTSNEDIIGIATYNVLPDRVRSVLAFSESMLFIEA